MPNTSESQRFNLLVELVHQVRLAWRLFWDRRVPVTAKLVVPTALAALISPIDLVPDFFIGLFGLGVLDDIAVIAVALRLLVALAPEDVVAEHLARLRGQTDRPTVDATFRTIGDPS
ncbi:MAG: DUF1232 domain-containing protein [Dehalococcoidia bacterium]